MKLSLDVPNGCIIIIHKVVRYYDNYCDSVAANATRSQIIARSELTRAAGRAAGSFEVLMLAARCAFAATLSQKNARSNNNIIRSGLSKKIAML